MSEELLEKAIDFVQMHDSGLDDYRSRNLNRECVKMFLERIYNNK